MRSRKLIEQSKQQAKEEEGAAAPANPPGEETKEGEASKEEQEEEEESETEDEEAALAARMHSASAAASNKSNKRGKGKGNEGKGKASEKDKRKKKLRKRKADGDDEAARSVRRSLPSAHGSNNGDVVSMAGFQPSSHREGQVLKWSNALSLRDILAAENQDVTGQAYNQAKRQKTSLEKDQLGSPLYVHIASQIDLATKAMKIAADKMMSSKCSKEQREALISEVVAEVGAQNLPPRWMAACFNLYIKNMVVDSKDAEQLLVDVCRPHRAPGQWTEAARKCEKSHLLSGQ